MKRDFYLTFILGLALFNILIRLPFLEIPLYNDEFNYFEGVVKIYQNNLNPFTEFWSYKPPFLFELTALFFKVFNMSRIWGRLVIYLFSSLSIIFTYLLGRIIFSRTVGFFAAILLFFFPLFSGHSFLFLDAVPSVALFLMTLFFYFNNNLIWYLFFGSFLVLTKEPLVFIPLFIAVFDVLKNYKKGVKFNFKSLKKSFLLVLPILLFIVWMVVNKKIFGWFLWPYNVNYFLIKKSFLLELLKTLEYIFNDVFYSQLLFLVLTPLIYLFLVFGLLKKKNENVIIKSEVIFFNFIFWFYFVFFSFGPFISRYLLFAAPLIFLSFCWLIENLNREATLRMVVFICFMFITHSFYHSFLSPYSSEADLSILRQIFVRKIVAEYVETNIKNSLVISFWDQGLVDNFYDKGIEFDSGYFNNKIQNKLLTCPLKQGIRESCKEQVYFLLPSNKSFRDCNLWEKDFILVKELRLKFLPNKKVDTEKIKLFRLKDEKID